MLKIIIEALKNNKKNNDITNKTEKKNYNSINKNPIDKNPIDKNPINKNPINKNPIDKNPTDKNPIDKKITKKTRNILPNYLECHSSKRCKYCDFIVTQKHYKPSVYGEKYCSTQCLLHDYDE